HGWPESAEAQDGPYSAVLPEQDRSEGTRSAAQGRMQEQAVFGYFFPRKKVTRRKGGRGQWRHPIKWISPQFLSQPANQLPQQSMNNPKKKG
ncbi:hypothetical protein, partial [Pseudomonas hunanensis]|uniref:hypothetical protein n=1 Tax=Pseudomonas hunanensis TaxID=1247546 RepID=UPI00286A4DB2